MALGLPFAGVGFGLPDDRVLPVGASTRQAADVLRRDFPSRDTASLSVVAATATGDLGAYAPGRPDEAAEPPRPIGVGGP